MSNAQLSRSEFVEFVRAAKLAVVSTVTPEGRPEAAVLEIAALGDGTLLFDCRPIARKVRNLAKNTRVALVIGWDPVTLQVEGEAELLMGIEREAMLGLYAQQHAVNPAIADDLMLYQVSVDWLRYVEVGQPPTVAEGVPA